MITGVGTGVGPSLAAFNGRLYMAWKGAGIDHDIYWNYLERGNWIAQHKVGGARTSGDPPLHSATITFIWPGRALAAAVQISEMFAATTASVGRPLVDSKTRVPSLMVVVAQRAPDVLAWSTESGDGR